MIENPQEAQESHTPAPDVQTDTAPSSATPPQPKPGKVRVRITRTEKAYLDLLRVARRSRYTAIFVPDVADFSEVESCLIVFNHAQMVNKPVGTVSPMDVLGK